MSLSDKNFLGTASDDDRMDYRTALKIMDRVVSDYLQRREPQDDLLPDEAEVTEAYK